MSLSLKPKSNRLKNVTITSAVIVGASLVILNTFPHLKQSLYDYFTQSKDGSDEEDVNAPIELSSEELAEGDKVSSKDIAEESIVDVNEWSNDDLKSWLKKKEVNTPQDASHSNLVSLVKSIQEDFD
ncbi:hypothetical protein PSN45_000645 [Yamadazyma tenuis]|uniref:Uncharacterized protein n=1 Tax=Candida tenuis (strain ATCC 10573 / BCRC 21748 / CBS 615 / JCM 9827 / NBRC 10315 / NRRL Y-1498 / VKM Y-70) TaxID=590646 RepID=G3B9P9_CANTC|nr:uncharacterized protein CANTEDRAFT_135869 [Yamadazyma tenuis ATCC 10573]EGV62713.1 hypothetical protein CANTEDRAFT_135869 [Yamadazyma tenuis ATCC 10573]WEJ93184.1 hypothetical protein PSN45_000645 [Yamadazyma tenuis]